jgi:serine/threonine protein kinase
MPKKQAQTKHVVVNHNDVRPCVAFMFEAELAAATDGFSHACCIGAGGLGSVYMAAGLQGLAFDESHFAVKKLDITGMSRGGHIQLLQDIQTMGACRHENLVPLLAFSAHHCASERHVCLVMPLMQGGSLEDLIALDTDAERRLKLVSGTPIREFAPLTWQQRLVVGLGAITGLEYLHTPDLHAYKPALVHGNLKPSNILLDLYGNVRLADMGLARELADGFVDRQCTCPGRIDEAGDGYGRVVKLNSCVN